MSLSGLVEQWRADASRADELASHSAWQKPGARRNLRIGAETLRLCATALETALANGARKVQHRITPEQQEALAVALEEAAARVRAGVPESFEYAVEDDIDWIWVSPTHRLPGMRSPLFRTFDIHW